VVNPGPHLNLTQLATFAEFTRLGTLTAAAGSLGYTPGAVSQHLAALEKALGARLVERSGRLLVLTDAGHLLARHASAILQDEQDALRAVGALDGRPAGPVVVGTWGSTAATLLAPIVHESARRFPDVVVRSREVDLDAAAEAVSRGLVDVAFGLDYADAPLPRDPGIRVVELLEEEFLVAVAPAASGTRAGSAAPELLAEASWILPPAGSQYGAALRAGFRKRGFEPHVVHEVTDTAASLHLAAAGLGVTVMTELMRRLNPDPTLLGLTMDDPLTRTVVLLAPARHVAGRVAAFIEVVSTVMPSLAGRGPAPSPGLHPG
jgi:DNA-binding transcriptional LysR family regulator